MKFDEVKGHLDGGRMVARQSWDKGIYLYKQEETTLRPGQAVRNPALQRHMARVDRPIMITSHLDLVMSNGNIFCGWQMGWEDAVATDWFPVIEDGDELYLGGVDQQEGSEAPVKETKPEEKDEVVEKPEVHGGEEIPAGGFMAKEEKAEGPPAEKKEEGISEVTVQENSEQTEHTEEKKDEGDTGGVAESSDHQTE